MKKYILIIIGILTSISLSAQNAEEYLSTVIEKMKSYNDISISFIYDYQNTEAGIHDRCNGYASMKGNSYSIDINGQKMICNGEVLWTYLIDDEEVMISEVTEDNNTSPLAIIDSFTGNIEVSYGDGLSCADIEMLIIKEKDNTTFDFINLYVNKNDLTIKEIAFHASDGYITDFLITSFITNQDLPDSMFIFDETIHPNVEVIDMR